MSAAMVKTLQFDSYGMLEPCRDVTKSCGSGMPPGYHKHDPPANKNTPLENKLRKKAKGLKCTNSPIPTNQLHLPNLKS